MIIRLVKLFLGSTGIRFFAFFVDCFIKDIRVSGLTISQEYNGGFSQSLLICFGFADKVILILKIMNDS